MVDEMLIGSGQDNHEGICMKNLIHIYMNLDKDSYIM